MPRVTSSHGSVRATRSESTAQMLGQVHLFFHAEKGLRLTCGDGRHSLIVLCASSMSLAMSERAGIQSFFKKAPCPDHVVDLTADTTLIDKTPKKRKAEAILSDDAASPSPKKKTVSLATFQSWKYDCYRVSQRSSWRV